MKVVAKILYIKTCTIFVHNIFTCLRLLYMLFCFIDNSSYHQILAWNKIFIENDLGVWETLTSGTWNKCLQICEVAADMILNCPL